MNQNSKILIVDDSAFDRNILSSILINRGFQVSCLDSGEKCLEEIYAIKPDLILMDIMMPKILGSNVLHSIREKHSSIELPVIMVSGVSDVSIIVESFALGANDYITKPINFDIAERRIMTHLKIASLSKQLCRLKEIEAIGAMITTYNHEINNPLAIILGCVSSLEKNNDQKSLDKLRAAVWRVADIVKSIEDVTYISEKGSIQYEEYSGNSKMLKLYKTKTVKE